MLRKPIEQHHTSKLCIQDQRARNSDGRHITPFGCVPIGAPEIFVPRIGMGEAGISAIVPAIANATPMPQAD